MSQITTTPTPNPNAGTELVPISDGQSHPGHGDQAAATILPDEDREGTSPRVYTTCSGQEIDDHLDKLLECPVCYEVILPPILFCVGGHSTCQSCRMSITKCPVCRGEFTNVRNLFAEQFLEKCQFKCKFGCSVCLPGKELAVHHKECGYRPIYCRECDQMVNYCDYLHHLETKDKLEKQKASECSTGFEIDEEDLTAGFLSPGHRVTIWEPTWMNCYGCNFFCSLEYNGELWWIWVSSLESHGCDFKCQILLWSKEQESEHTYFGAVHSVRSGADEVLRSGKCLILTDQALKNFMVQGGIDILVRIESTYVAPRTRRGVEVQSPLEITNPNRPRRYLNPRPHTRSSIQRQQNQNQQTPSTSRPGLRSSARLELGATGSVSASRIPVISSSPSVSGSNNDATHVSAHSSRSQEPVSSTRPRLARGPRQSNNNNSEHRIIIEASHHRATRHVRYVNAVQNNRGQLGGQIILQDVNEPRVNLDMNLSSEVD